MKYLKLTLMLLTFFSFLALTPGCLKKKAGNSLDQTETNSMTSQPEENVLRLFIWEGYAPEKYVKEFEKEIEKKYGRKVKLEITFANTPDDFFNSIRGKNADIVTISHHMIKDKRYNFIKKGLIIPPDFKNIPNYAHVNPSFKMAEYHTSNQIVYGVPIAFGPYALVYNTKIFKKAPQSWNVFWDPAYKNRYTLGSSEYIYNVNLTALAMGYPREEISNFDKLNNKKFKEKLRQLAANAHSFWVGADQPKDLLGLSLAASWGDILSALKKKGEVWKMATPKEGTLWWIDEHVLTWALKDRPFMKKVAEEWINKVLSPAYQVNNYVYEGVLCPVITNIPGDNLPPEELKRITACKSPLSDETGRILQHVHSHRERNGLKSLWEKAMTGIPPKGNLQK